MQYKYNKEYSNIQKIIPTSVRKQICTVPTNVITTISEDKRQLQVSNSSNSRTYVLPRLPHNTFFEIVENKLIIVFNYHVKQNYQKLFIKNLCGTFDSHFQNACQGVAQDYKKSIHIFGTGYKSILHADTHTLEIFAGFSCSKKVKLHPQVAAKLESNGTVVHFTGINKEIVYSMAATIIKVRKHNVYKGNGIKYLNQIIHLKQVKKK